MFLFNSKFLNIIHPIFERKIEIQHNKEVNLNLYIIVIISKYERGYDYISYIHW